MNLFEAREILKENGYSVNTLNEGCYGSGSGSCGYGGEVSLTRARRSYNSCGTGGKSHAELVYPCGGGTPYYRSTGGGGGGSYRSKNHMKPEELEARRAKIAANKAKLAEFEEKQLPKLAKLFKVSNDDVRAFRDGTKITAYVKLSDENELKFICPDGKPEFFHIDYEGFEFGGKLSELKSTINTIEKIGDLLKSFSNLK